MGIYSYLFTVVLTKFSVFNFDDFLQVFIYGNSRKFFENIDENLYYLIIIQFIQLYTTPCNEIQI